MDFLRLSRSRSGSSSNKKRSPLPSPSGNRRSSGPDTDAATTNSLLSPSHALDQRASSGASSGTGIGAALSKVVSPMLPSSPSSKKGVLPLINEKQQQMDDNGQLQVIEFSFPSLLSPPNPAFVSGSEARGILINAQRPSLTPSMSEGRVQTRSSSSSQLGVATSSSSSPPSSGSIFKRSSVSGPSSTSYPGPPSSVRPPHLRTSVSSESMLASSKNAKPIYSTNLDSGTSAATVSTDPRGRARIRFAPLPDPRRPRSHSTGRDIWFDEDSENHIHINTRDGTEASPSSWSSLNGSSAQSNTLSTSLSDNNMDEYSTSPGKSISHRRTSSTLSKLLQPLKLGRSKSRESDKPNSPDSDQSHRLSLSTSPSLSQWMNGGEPLARSISTGAGSAEIERQRREEFRSSGVPLKKSSTQESNGNNKGPAPQRRILYPSVAQGGTRRRNGPKGPKVVEPEFVEWTNPSARVGVSQAQAEEEDDGSGMAWIKKRRAERERKAKEEAEVAAAAAASANALGTPPQDGQTAEKEDTTHVKASSEDTIRMSNYDKETAQAVPQVTIQKEGHVEEDDRRKSADSQSTLEVRTSEEEMSKKAAEEKSPPEEEEEEEEGDDVSSPSEDEAEENVDDLTAAEIEEEERLAEEARRTTGGASREVYHSHEHQASTYTFIAPSRANSTGGTGSSLNLPPFERQLSYTSSIKADVPRSIAASHPGDWPLREHVVVPPC